MKDKKKSCSLPCQLGATGASIANKDINRSQRAKVETQAWVCTTWQTGKVWCFRGDKICEGNKLITKSGISKGD